jgi:hypothetical protein
MQIFVTDKFNGKTITLQVESGTTICEVMRKIQEKDGTYPFSIRLIYAGKQLEYCVSPPVCTACNPIPPCTGRCRTLDDYNVQDQNVIERIPRLRGGGLDLGVRSLVVSA